jgi:hypothetical protein
VPSYVRSVTLDAWAETTPWDCLTNPAASCASLTHDHPTMVGDKCAVPECQQTLHAGEVCYYVVQLPRDPFDREQAVCWRHVRPGRGPVVPTQRIPGPGVTNVTGGCGMAPCGHPGCVTHCLRP